MKIIITQKEAGIEIKAFLKNISMSASLIKKLKKIPNGILVNGLHQNVNYRLIEGDILEINYDDTQEEVNEYLEPVNIHIEIIYEDENITAVNKGPNMPTHESINNRGNSLANALAYRYKDKPYVFRATNRLDKDTSGVVLTANNKYYAGLLSTKIKNGEIEKEYLAVVSGNLQGSGRIEIGIKRMGESIIKRIASDDGEYALTEYKVIASCDEASLVLVRPQTGRTHQIRVHMAYIGHPIIGDEMYSCKSELIDRQALHCYKMNVLGIGSFVASVPNDMKNLIRRYFNESIL